MILHPEDNLGLFVAYNVFNDALRERLVAEFMDRYYGEGSPATISETLALSQEDMARFTGSYRWVRYPRSTLGKLTALVPGPVNVDMLANDDGTLSVSFFGAPPEWIYAPVAPLEFKQVAGGVQEISGLEFDLGDTLVFREDDSGEIDFAFVPLHTVALEKTAGYEAGVVQTGALGSFLLVFLSPIVVWPVGALIRRIRKQKSTATSGAKRAKWVGGIVSLLNFILLMTLILAIGGGLMFGVPIIVHVALVIPIVTMLLTLVMLWMTFLAWKDNYWSFVGRIYYSFMTLSAALFVLWANYWNLLGWHF
jgi:hypothetical protein